MQALVRHLHAFVDRGRADARRSGRRRSRPSPRPGTSPTSAARSSCSGRTRSGVSMLVDALANPRPRGGDRVDRARPVLRPRLAAARLRRAHRRDGRPAIRRGSTAACSTSTARRSPAPSSTCGRTATTGSTRFRSPRAPRTTYAGVSSRATTARYAFLAVRPVPYPIPDDGPVGRMLAATGRHPWRPAHIHVIVRALGYARSSRTSSTPTATTSTPTPCSPSSRRCCASSSPRARRRPRAPRRRGGRWVSLEIDVVLVPADEAGEPTDPGRTA